MTKLVAGYVLGRVTSPHQFVFVFVTSTVRYVLNYYMTHKALG